MILLLVALHYFGRSFLDFLPATLPAPIGEGGGRTYSYVRWQTALSEVSASPLGACSGPSPLTGGGPSRILGSEDPWGGPRGLLPFPSMGVGSVRPAPRPGLVARPHPLPFFLPST